MQRVSHLSLLPTGLRTGWGDLPDAERWPRVAGKVRSTGGLPEGKGKMPKLNKLCKYIYERGLLWTCLYIMRSICTGIVYNLQNIILHIDMYIIRIEKHRYSISHSTSLLHVASLYHTVEENRTR